MINADILVSTISVVPELLAPVPDHDMNDAMGVGSQGVDEDDVRSSLYPPTAAPPYGLQEGASLLPVFAAIGAFVPIVFCLCRI